MYDKSMILKRTQQHWNWRIGGIAKSQRHADKFMKVKKEVGARENTRFSSTSMLDTRWGKLYEYKRKENSLHA
jgi:hypothetical protein